MHLRGTRGASKVREARRPLFLDEPVPLTRPSWVNFETELRPCQDVHVVPRLGKGSFTSSQTLTRNYQEVLRAFRRMV